MPWGLGLRRGLVRMSFEGAPYEDYSGFEPAYVQSHDVLGMEDL